MRAMTLEGFVREVLDENLDSHTEARYIMYTDRREDG